MKQIPRNMLAAAGDAAKYFEKIDTPNGQPKLISSLLNDFPW